MGINDQRNEFKTFLEVSLKQMKLIFFKHQVDLSRGLHKNRERSLLILMSYKRDYHDEVRNNFG